MFYENLKKACEARNTTVTALLKRMKMGTANGTFWKNGSSPSIDVVVKISELLNVSIDCLLKDEDGTEWVYHPESELDGLYFFAKYYLGKEDADIMFNIAGIDISQLENGIENFKSEEEMEDSPPKEKPQKTIVFPSDKKISSNALDWISAHCNLSPLYFSMKTPICRSDLIEPFFYYGTPENTKTVEEVIKIPEIAKMEREFLKRKREKSVLQTEGSAVQKQQGGLFNKKYEGLMREIIDGYEEIIYQFGGDIGAQFVLLDRFRQAADKLSKEIASRKELA